jgi:uncharacterized protein (TIGR03000 family)
MFRTTYTLSGILVLSVVAVLVTPGLSQAQHGGLGGGGHFGGAHVGGYHGAVPLGGYHTVNRGAGYYGGYRHPYAGYGYRPYYDSFGYSPNFYDDSGYSPLYDGGATYGTSAAGANQASYPPPAAEIPSDTSAHVTVTVPPGAEIWFDGTATTSTGTVRQFESPPLTPGKHSYEILARWNENGHEVTQTQRVEVTPGANVSVSFPVQAVKKD